MKIYLDASCLNRPFDDQDQVRVRLESEVVVLISERIDSGEWEEVSSEMMVWEIAAIPDAARRERVEELLPPKSRCARLTGETYRRAAVLESLGFKPADAVHIAAAEEQRADVLLSCDDRMCRTARRQRAKLHVKVLNPVDWLREIDDGANG